MHLVKLSALLVTLLFAAVGLLTLFSLRNLPASGQEGVGAQLAMRNGDVNCDGKINVIDPVYLLQYLFQRGPEPCAFAQAPGFADVVSELQTLNKTTAAILTELQSPLRPKWPPRPEDIVNIFGSKSSNVFSVPNDKNLVITDITFVAASTGESQSFVDLLSQVGNEQPTLKIRLVEVPGVDGVGATGSPIVIMKTVLYHSPVGLVFAPGSTVRANTNTSQGFNLVGYLTPRA